MASEEDPTVYGEEDLDEDDDDTEEEEEDEEDLTLTTHQPDFEDDVDVDVDDDEDDSTSSSNLVAGQVTIAVAGALPTASVPASNVPASNSILLPDPKRPRVEEVSIAAVEKKPLPADESRRLFQRLWTDEDEIELLQGFLDYTTQRGNNNSSSHHHHHDTTAFYDQIKNKLQLDFNKNQLVEKLRRLKKKYRNVVSKIGSGKEYVFKSPHDQTTFEISSKIWSGATVRGGVGTAPASAAGDEAGFDDDESNPNPNPNINDHNNNGIDMNSAEKRGSRSRKRSRAGAGAGTIKVEEKPAINQQPHHQTPVPVAGSIPNLIEETVRSCLSPLFKELLHNVMNANGSCGSRGFGGLTMSPMPLGFGGPMNFTSSGEMVDEKWRKQQILELEVYSKRLELVQDQIKSSLEELRSKGS